MKIKINNAFIFILMLTTLFIISSCGNNNNEWENNDDSVIHNSSEWKIQNSSSAKLLNCSNLEIWPSCKEGDSVTNITDKNFNVKDLCNDNIEQNIDNYNINILDSGLQLWVIKNRENEFAEFKTLKYESVDEDNKTINILLDLTLFDLDSEVLENWVVDSRKDILSDILKEGLEGFTTKNWENVSWYSLKDWDEINLYFLGWYNKKPYLKKQDFIYSDNIKTESELKYFCYVENGMMKIAYKYNENEIEEDSTNIVDEILNSYQTLYDQKEYSYWTYLISSINNYDKFLNEEWSINIIISDMFFNLDDENKEIFWVDDNGEANSVDFNKENIKYLSQEYQDTNFYKIYNEKIANSFNYKCKNNETLYILWTNLAWAWNIENMRNYFEEKLFSNCNVSFNY